GTEIDLSAAMFMMTGDEVIYLFSGNYDEYMKFNAQYAIQWDMICYANAHGFKKYNFYGISGNFDKKDPEYGVYEFKRGFSGYVEELIGEFEIPVKKQTYALFSIINNTKQFIKKCLGK
ncbi:MAG: peptidoglycan bridge formation glycyltransferase FemA/FemB family protein, partial [Firmicutes bacterium]|nr:peptidoglycan bridge formation glycyltransferase FemA/FemB family protein [Bacillota bacterium]